MMALCVASTVASEDQELEQLKTDIWVGFKEMMREISGKMDTMDPATDLKELLKPLGEKHSSVGQKIKAFKESHPEADVAPQSLIALNTDQMQKLKTELASGNWLCDKARGPLTV